MNIDMIYVVVYNFVILWFLEIFIVVERELLDEFFCMILEIINIRLCMY